MPVTRQAVLRQQDLKRFAAEAIDRLRDEIRKPLDALNTPYHKASPYRKSVALLSAKRPFLTAIDTMLEAAKERIQSGVASEDSIQGLLFALEQLANWPRKFRPQRNKTDPSSYPVLYQMIREKSPEKRRQAKSDAQAAIVGLCISGNSGYSDRKGIQKSLKKFAPITAPPRGSEVDQIRRSSGTEPATQNTVVECLRELHTTLCELAHCPEGTFQANISLSFTPKFNVSNEDVVLEVFISHNHTDDEDLSSSCREAHIHAYVQGSDIKFEETGNKVDELCKLIHDQDPARLKLQAFRRSLFRSLPERRDPPMIALQLPSVPLTSLLETTHMRTDRQRRLLLSFLLAKAVWRFYDVDWMAEDWTREAVHFMHLTTPAKPALSYKPFIVTPLRPSAQRPDLSHRSHRLPRILALGIVLLEIEVGRAIVPAEAGNIGDYNWANKAHTDAGNFLQSEEWFKRRQKQTPKPLAKAIEICVNPGPELVDTDNVRSSLYTAIVQRLGKLFSAMWLPDGGPPEACTLDPIDFIGTNASSYPNVDDSKQMKRQIVTRDSFSSNALRRPADLLPNPTYVCQNDELEHDGLFAAEDSHSIPTGLCDQSTTWLLEFKKLRKKFNLSRDSHRIKLAILDTGVECDHPDFRDKPIIAYKSFINEDDESARRDLSGHGTHIAGIILSLTTNVDVYVAQITNSRVSNNRDSVVKALQWAREEWKVNMISMSFGYHKISGKDIVRKEVDSCLKQDIVIFASASNDGANRPRTYPGKYEGVLCIHSATGLGNPSPFNPTAERKIKNFCVLGDGVESSWPQQENGNGRKHMSGTSFATPVAASIAAFMLSYIHCKLPDVEWNTNPMSPGGVKAIFEEMARSNRRMDYDIVSPMSFFHDRGPDWVRQRFMEILHGYSL